MSDAKPIKVLLFCAMGMSSSLLENKTREAAKAAGVAFDLKAITQSEISMWDFKEKFVDIVLVAPQVRFKKKSVTAAAAPHNVIVQDIEPMLFGMADGEALFRQVMAAIEARDARPAGG